MNQPATEILFQNGLLPWWTLDDKRRAAEVRQLIGMQFDRQSQRLGRTKHPRRIGASVSTPFIPHRQL